MTALAILAGRFARAILRLRGGGSAAPGRVLLALSPKFLCQPPQPVVRTPVVGKPVEEKDALLWHGDILAQAPPKVAS